MVDRVMRNLVEEILATGYTYADPNRKGVNRIEINTKTLEIDISENFPILSLRSLPYKNGFMELMVFLSGSNDIRDLWTHGVNFWDKDWGNFLVKKGHEERSGIILKNRWKNLKDFELVDHKELYNLGDIYPRLMRDFNGFDQIKHAVETLKNNSNSTKQTITMWDPSKSESCALTCCHWSFELLPVKDSNTLDLKWHQHSVDTFLGLPTNIVYYAGMLTLIANYVGMGVGKIYPDLSNVHLYDNAIEEAGELISREPKEENRPILTGVRKPYENETFDEYILSIKDWKIEQYHPHEGIKVEMLAYNK